MSGETTEDWAAGIVPKAPVQIARKSPEQRASIEKAATRSEFQPIYQQDFEEVKPIDRIKSSIFPTGYGKGSFIGFVGAPGSGKTRTLVQEVVNACTEGWDSLYLYNESVKPKFDHFVKRICEEMGITNAMTIKNIGWADMSKKILKTAEYDGITAYVNRSWIGQVRYWLDHIAHNPGIVVIDSISKVGRRYIPQLWEVNEDLIKGLTELYAERKIEPVTFLTHQKSLSPREKHDDSVVGGYGLVHELDMVCVFKTHDVDRWDAGRYGWPEGTMQYTVQITKDRYNIGEFQEHVVVIKDGKLTLAETLSSRVEDTKARSQVNQAKSSEGSAVSAGDIWGDG